MLTVFADVCVGWGRRLRLPSRLRIGELDPSAETRGTHAVTHPAVALAFELGQLSLLRGSQDLVEGRFSLTLVGGGLRRQVANGCGRLFNAGCIIRLYGRVQALARSLHAAVYRCLRGGRISEDGSRLLLLGGRQTQQSGQIVDTMLDKVSGIGAGRRALGD